jgi:hypothetical protein
MIIDMRHKLVQICPRMAREASCRGSALGWVRPAPVAHHGAAQGRTGGARKQPPFPLIRRHGRLVQFPYVRRGFGQPTWRPENGGRRLPDRPLSPPTPAGSIGGCHAIFSPENSHCGNTQ